MTLTPLRRPLLAWLAAALLVRTGPLLAQPAGKGATPEPLALSAQPYEIKSLGMTLRLPIGARLDTSSVGTVNASFTLIAQDNTWIIKLHSPESRDQTLTPARVAGGLLEELRQTWTARDPATNKVKMSAITVLGRDDALVINGFPAARFYARVPRPGGAVLVTGYTVFNIAEGRFVIFQLDCLEAELQRARSAYETILATVRFRDPTAVSADRAAGLLAGQRLLEHFNSEDLLSMIPAQRQFYRLYRPGKTGLEGDDAEVAYEVIEIHKGQRGELDPAKPKRHWLQPDRDWGFIVSVKARFLDGKRIVDSESISFLALDRSSEAWSTRMAIKQGKDSALFTETGAREGNSIEVNIIQPTQPQETKRWSTPPKGYLSQVETYLLPMMLVRFGAETDFAFYTYQTQKNDIMLRRDTFERSKTPGQWILKTRPDEDAAVDRTFINADGQIIRKELANGVVMEAIKPDRLARIWRNKGLPTD